MRKTFIFIILIFSMMFLLGTGKIEKYSAISNIYKTGSIPLRGETGFNIEDDYLTGIENQREVTTFDLGLDTSYTISVVDKNNTEKTSGFIFTGDKVQIKLNNEIVASPTVIVMGDTNGDGKISSLDYVKIKNHIMGSALLTGGAYLKSADYNNDNKISSLDYVKVKNYIMEKSSKVYTITYNANGGSGTMASNEVVENETTNLLRNKFTKSGSNFVNWNTKADGTGTTYQDVSKIILTDNTTLYAIWSDGEAPTVSSIAGGDALKSTTQSLTLKCSDSSGIAAYYFGKTNPTSSDNIVTTTASDLTALTSANGLTKNVSSAGTYYFACKDNSNNYAVKSIKIVTYTVNDLLVNLTGTKGTYTDANYSSSNSYVYIVKNGTTATASDLYTIPDGANSATFKGYSTEYYADNGNPTTAGAISKDSITIASGKTYYMWFDRITIYFRYQVQEGETFKVGDVNTTNTTYSWSVNDDNLVVRTVNSTNKSTTSLNSYRYGNFTNIDLYNNDPAAFFAIQKKGYKPVAGSEWACQSGCDEGVTFSQEKHDASSIIGTKACKNITGSSCTITLKANLEIDENYDEVYPTVEDITGGDTLKSATQNLTLKCSDNKKVVAYYFGKTNPENVDAITTTTETDLIALESSNGLTKEINEGGTYYLACKDSANNFTVKNIQINSYTVNDLLINITGAAGTYTDANYSSNDSHVYIVKDGATAKASDLYIAPEGANDATFKGYSTEYYADNGNPTTADAITKDPITIENSKTYYMWFNRFTVYFQYLVQEGETFQVGDANIDNTTYSWGVNDDNLVVRTTNSTNKSTTSLNSYRYGNFENVNLYNNDPTSYFAILKTGYKPVAGSEWSCQSGCDEGVTFSQDKYDASSIIKTKACKNVTGTSCIITLVANLELDDSYDDVNPTVEDITGGDTLKSATQNLTLKCSDNKKVVAYYFGQTNPENADAITTTTEADLTALESSSGLTKEINEVGTYYLACKDSANNFAVKSIQINSYTIVNLLENLTGTRGVYTDANYTIASSNDYIVKNGTSVTAVDVYTTPENTNAETFKGYSIRYYRDTSTYPLSNDTINVDNSRIYYMWFNRITVNFRYQVQDGENLYPGKINNSNWELNENNYVTRKSTTSSASTINISSYKYGASSVSLHVNDMEDEFAILKSGYLKVEGREWICADGCEGEVTFSEGVNDVSTLTGDKYCKDVTTATCNIVIKANFSAIMPIANKDFIGTNGINFVKVGLNNDGDNKNVVLRGLNLGEWLSRAIGLIPVNDGTLPVFDTGSENAYAREYTDNNIQLNYALYRNFYENMKGSITEARLENSDLTTDTEVYNKVWEANQAFYNNFISEQDIAILAQMGVNAVRVPVEWSYFIKINKFIGNTTKPSQKYIKDNGYTVMNYYQYEYSLLSESELEQRLQIMDWVVEECKKNGIYVIFDIHVVPGSANGGGIYPKRGGGQEFFKDDESGTNNGSVCKIDGNTKTIANIGNNVIHSKNYPCGRVFTQKLWQIIANRYNNNPGVAGYELINEPGTGDNVDALMEVYDDLYNVIRDVDAKHVIIMESPMRSGVAHYLDYPEKTNVDVEMPMPSEKGWTNVAYSVHDYFQNEDVVPDTIGKDENDNITYGHHLDGIADDLDGDGNGDENMCDVGSATFPSSDPDDIKIAIEEKVNYNLIDRNKYNVPLFVGETNWRRNCADKTWPYLIELYNRSGISYTFWGYKAARNYNWGMIYNIRGNNKSAIANLLSTTGRDDPDTIINKFSMKTLESGAIFDDGGRNFFGMLKDSWTKEVEVQYNGNGGTWSAASTSNYTVDDDGYLRWNSSTNTIVKHSLNSGILTKDGLYDYNGVNINWTKADSIAMPSKEYYVVNSKTEEKTYFDQTIPYTAKELFDAQGCESLSNVCTVTVYVNWVTEINVALIGDNKTFYSSNPNIFDELTNIFAGNSIYNISKISKESSSLLDKAGYSLDSDDTNVRTIAYNLANTSYDIAVLQDKNEVLNSNLHDFDAGVTEISNKLKNTNPNISIYLRESWQKNDTNFAKNQEIAFDYVNRISIKNNYKIVHDGKAFSQYGKNSTLDNLYLTDNNNSSVEGAYLAALCTYTRITNIDPTTVTYVSSGLTDTVASNLKNIAKNICYLK